MNALLKLAELSKAAVVTPTFKLSTVETKEASNGHTGFRATLNDGTKVTFWESTLEQVVEEVDEDTWRLKPGVKPSNNPDRGLIPADKVDSGSFWK